MVQSIRSLQQRDLLTFQKDFGKLCATCVLDVSLASMMCSPPDVSVNIQKRDGRSGHSPMICPRCMQATALILSRE